MKNESKNKVHQKMTQHNLCIQVGYPSGGTLESGRELVSESNLKKGENTSMSKDHVSNTVDTRLLPSQTATQVPAMGLAALVLIRTTVFVLMHVKNGTCFWFD